MKKIIQSLTSDDQALAKIPLAEYPRPQLRRSSFLCLNGEWDLAMSKTWPSIFSYKIMVPFAVESALSGVKRNLERQEMLFYRKKFPLDQSFIKDKVILHFDGVDQIADVYFNQHHVGHHEGGYLPFEIDISDLLQVENELIVQVKDDLDQTYGYGKQSHHSHGMWYTKSSGIWKTVWLESVPQSYFERIIIDTSLDTMTIKTLGNVQNKTLILHHEKNDEVFDFSEDEITIRIKNPHLWSPEDPFLYYFTLKGEEDEIHSYFALRTIEIKNCNGYQYLFLNGKPYFFHGVLDQGYFSDGLLTPKSYKKYEEEILLLKKWGFNTIRKHIKIEPLYFYYLCDKLGMIVFQDMVNNGRYSFFRDSVLPNIGIKYWPQRGKHSPKAIKEHFLKMTFETLTLLHNHPSICYYTIFNEGWGQFSADRIYRLVKKQEPSRIIDATSGWFYGKESDVDSHHIYFKNKKLRYKSRPIILSEFGGYVFKISQHSFCLNKTYGYRIFKTQEEWQSALVTLYQKQVIPYIKKGLCASIYTQVSDVEEETNGLLTYDRRVMKVNQNIMDEIAIQIKRALEEVEKS